MDINAPIQYDWKFRWDEGMSNPYPVVNPLLQAIIEKNVEKIENIFLLGANLEKVDTETFQRILWHVLDDYKVMKTIVEHGFIGHYGYFRDFTCLSPQAYTCGLIGRAWQLNAYDVMELMAINGFTSSYYTFFVGNESYDFRKICFQNNLLKPIIILLENGESVDTFDSLCRYYPDSNVTLFLRKTLWIKRKSIGLDSFKFKIIPKPNLETPGIFFRKSVEKRNQDLMEDYQDRIMVQQKFIMQLGYEKWYEISRKDEELSKLMGEILTLKARGIL